MNIVVPVPKTDRNNRYILVIPDYFTKWPEPLAHPDHGAETIAEKLVDDVICRHGAPRMIHTDQGKDFDSKLIKALCELLEIEKTRTTQQLESDGLMERLNKTLITMIRSLVDEEQKTWDTILPKVLLGYRSSVQSTTGYSPFYLMHGSEVMLPIDIMFRGVKERFVDKQRSQLEKAYGTVRKNANLKQCRQKYYYDRKVQYSGLKTRYSIGD